MSVELCGDFCNCLITSKLLSTNRDEDCRDPVIGSLGSKLNLSPYGNCKGWFAVTVPFTFFVFVEDAAITWFAATLESCAVKLIFLINLSSL